MAPDPETADGFHLGADIELLSQYSREKEVLFPPCTILTLGRQKVPWPSHDRVVHGRPRAETLMGRYGTRHEEDGKQYVLVKAVPTFV